VRLPLLDAEVLAATLTAGRAAADLDRPATPADAAALSLDLLGVGGRADPDLHRNATIRTLYARLIATDAFRAACGRISASYAW
jgi:hypothetical protein